MFPARGPRNPATVIIPRMKRWWEGDSAVYGLGWEVVEATCGVLIWLSMPDSSFSGDDIVRDPNQLWAY